MLCFIPFASAYALTADEEARTVSYVKALLDCKLTLGDYEKKTWDDQQRDIERAKAYWIDYQQRHDEK